MLVVESFPMAGSSPRATHLCAPQRGEERVEMLLLCVYEVWGRVHVCVLYVCVCLHVNSQLMEINMVNPIMCMFQGEVMCR